ncbi:MAG: DMT family transporter [Rhodospirillales bacterium]|nr:DMT family transporter [Rhodospirillales bacterium]
MSVQIGQRTGRIDAAWLLRYGAGPLFILLWSSGFIFVRVALVYTDPLTMLAVRYALVELVLLPFLLLLRPPAPRGGEWVHLGMTGLLVQAGNFAFINLALAHGLSAGGSALIASLQPILVGLLAPFLAGESVSARRWFGLALGLAGTVGVILARNQVGAGLPALGLLFAVCALFSMTGGTLYERRYGTGVHPVAANMVQCAVGLAVSLPLAMWLEPMRFVPAMPLLWSLGYLVVGNSLVALMLLLAMIRLGEASRVSALFFMVPPTTALIAWATLGEHLPLLGWVGMAVSATGVAIVTLERRRR